MLWRPCLLTRSGVTTWRKAGKGYPNKGWRPGRHQESPEKSGFLGVCPRSFQGPPPGGRPAKDAQTRDGGLADIKKALKNKAFLGSVPAVSMLYFAFSFSLLYRICPGFDELPLSLGDAAFGAERIAYIIAMEPDDLAVIPR